MGGLSLFKPRGKWETCGEQVKQLGRPVSGEKKLHWSIRNTPACMKIFQIVCKKF